MKITKTRDLAFSFKPYGAAGKRYVSLAAMAFIDLTAPDAPLTEQDMWKAVPGVLGDPPILDEGMPKIQGEVLAAGAAYAPRGETRKALAARILIGNVEKTINAFGERFWLPDGSISEPRPFSSMPIRFDNAFGGPDFPQNPKGKGMAPVRLPDGRQATPLPNLERPGRMIGAPDDRPEPAGFGPLDITWAQRAAYNGTYDQRWKAERWPGLPEDTDFRLFNRAQKDQWLPGFFKGNESFEIENMHPDMPLIAGRLPGLRARMFLTLFDNYALYGDPATFRERFVEVPARLETVWFFPGILRGALVYRGSIENRDDECRDLIRAYLAWERPDERPGTIEEYAEKQRKAASRAVPVDMTPFKEAGKKMAGAVKMVKNSPKTLAAIRDRAINGAPAMPVTPEEMAAKAEEIASANMATLDKLEAVARDLHGKFGHLAEIDLGRFDAMRETVRQALARSKDVAANVGKALAKANAKKADIISRANAFMDKAPGPEAFAARGADISAFKEQGLDLGYRFPDKEETGVPFHDAGFPFVVACRRNLEASPEAREKLRRLGITDPLARRAWLGLNPEDKREPGEAWGLPKAPDGAPAPSVLLPAGLVFPRFKGPSLTRLLIRPAAAQGDFIAYEGDLQVPGSDQSLLYLPPPDPGAPDGNCVQTADELQALFLEEEIGDACGVCVLPDPKAKPGPEAAKALANATALAVILPQGTSLSGELWGSWKAAYPKAVPVILPKGRTVFESRAAGADIRTIIMEALPGAFAARHAIEPGLPKPGEKPSGSPIPPLVFPKLDMAGAASSAMDARKAQAEPLKAELTAMKKRIEEQAAADMAKHGTTLQETLAKAAGDSGKSPAERMGDPVGKLIAERDRHAAMGALTPELEAKFAETIQKTKATMERAETKFHEGMAKIAASKETFAKAKAKIAEKTIPGMSLDDMRAAGIDPDLARVMTRTEVLERYKLGLSFAKRNLTGLNLSELDLSGIDLSEAILKNTDFSCSVLDGANLSKAIAPKANFSKASLHNANLTMSLFMGANLRKANLCEAVLRQTALREADLTKADLSGAKLAMAVLSKAKLRKTRFADASMTLTLFEGSDMSKTDFAGASLHKTVFRNLTMDRTDFTKAGLESVTFSGVTGAGVLFTEADMRKFRMGKQCAMAGTNFRKADLIEACLRESDISSSDFRGARLDHAMIELCDAKGVILNRVSARRASIIKTDLAGADMFGLNLFLGSLRKSRLTGADLGHSNLYGVDFLHCVVGETIFTGANLKRTPLYGNTDALK